MSQKYEYFGKYILLERLAAGGMAEVFLGRAPGAGGIGKFVAIKRILPQFTNNKEFVDMFKDEAKIAVNLSHSNIVNIYEFGVEDAQFYLLMDYVEGRNVRQILNKMKQTGQSFSIDQVVFMVKEMAGGLDHAHRCLDGTTGKPLNITHRDMSPQNVMISFEGEVKIIDFGIAKAESKLETTRAGTLKGKFGYMSPEQAEGIEVDLRTDIFSLGIVLWELLANDRLFIANNEINTLRKIRDCQIPSLTKINPSIHPELERITLKALTKDRNHRYQTAAALYKDLSRFLNRHYPDFSSHDFSMFIKSIYADDILETRNRLVEYAKVPFKEKAAAAPTKSLEEDKTIVVAENFDPNETGTDTASVNEFNKGEDIETEPDDIVNPVPGLDFSDREKRKSEPEVLPNNVINAEIIQQHMEKQNKNRAPEKTQVGMKYKNAGGVSVEDFSREKSRWNSNTNPNAFSGAGSYSNYSQSGISSIRKTSNLPKKMLSYTFYTLVIIGTYLSLTASFPDTMRPVNKAVSKILGGLGFYSVVDGAGVNKAITAMGFKPIVPYQEDIKTTQSASQSTQENKEPVAPRNTIAPAGNVGLVIMSNPSGAEIIIDGKSTGRSTPSRISFTRGEVVDIRLRKKSYFEHKFGRVNTANLSSKTLKADLSKVPMAHLDIDVQPPRYAKLYINGKPIDVESLPVIRYPVMAGRELIIEAKNPMTKTSATRRIKLNEGDRETVILNLKRSPASSR